MKITTSIVIYIAILLFAPSRVIGQVKLACIELEPYKMKVLLVEIKDKKTKDLRLRNFSTESIEYKNPVVISSAEIHKAVADVTKKLNIENNIANDNIYIVAAQALFPENVLIDLKESLSYISLFKVDFVSSMHIGKMLHEGLNLSDEAVVIDANFYKTKLIGNAVAMSNKSDFSVAELESSDVVSVLKNETDLSVYKETLNVMVSELHKRYDFSKKNDQFYLTGECAWAFYTLFNGGTVLNDFCEFKVEDLEKHQANLTEKFYRYESLATSNIEAERVLKNYSKEQLIAGNLVLLQAIKGLNDYPEKKFFYCRNYAKTKLLQYLKNKI